MITGVKITPYLGYPDRVSFYVSNANGLSKKWIVDALSMDKLRYQIDGALRVLIRKEQKAQVFVRAVKNPLKEIHDAHFFMSEHNNYHIGNETGEHLSTKQLEKLNLGKYSYFQDERFFIAIKKMFDDCCNEYYLLCVTKKKPYEGEARAQQD